MATSVGILATDLGNFGGKLVNMFGEKLILLISRGGYDEKSFDLTGRILIYEEPDRPYVFCMLLGVPLFF